MTIGDSMAADQIAQDSTGRRGAADRYTWLMRCCRFASRNSIRHQPACAWCGSVCLRRAPRARGDSTAIWLTPRRRRSRSWVGGLRQPPARNNMEMGKSPAPPRARARFAAAARLPPANGQRARSRQSYCQCCGIWQRCRRPGTSLRSTGAVTIAAVPTRRSRCHHRSHRLRSGRSETDPIGPRRRRSQNSPRRILRLLRRQYCCLKGPKPLEIQAQPVRAPETAGNGVCGAEKHR